MYAQQRFIISEAKCQDQGMQRGPKYRGAREGLLENMVPESHPEDKKEARDKM